MFENAGSKLKVAITALFIVLSVLIVFAGIHIALYLPGLLGIIIGVMFIPVGILLLYLSLLFVATIADMAEDVKYIAKHMPIETAPKTDKTITENSDMNPPKNNENNIDFSWID